MTTKISRGRQWLTKADKVIFIVDIDFRAAFKSDADALSIWSVPQFTELQKFGSSPEYKR